MRFEANTSSDYSQRTSGFIRSGLLYLAGLIILAVTYVFFLSLTPTPKSPELKSDAATANATQPVNSELTQTKTPAENPIDTNTATTSSASASSNSVSTNLTTTNDNGAQSSKLSVNGKPVSIPVNGTTQTSIGDTNVTVTQSSNNSNDSNTSSTSLQVNSESN